MDHRSFAQFRACRANRAGECAALHEPFRADEWLLYTTDSPWSGHSRGFNRGRIFTRDGRLVASAAQEGLVRLRR